MFKKLLCLFGFHTPMIDSDTGIFERPRGYEIYVRDISFKCKHCGLRLAKFYQWGHTYHSGALHWFYNKYWD